MALPQAKLKKNSDNPMRGVALLVGGITIGLIVAYFGGKTISEFSLVKKTTPTPAPTIQPTTIPTTAPTKAPTSKPAAKPVDCGRFNTLNGNSKVTINFITSTGSMTGSTVIRIKGAGSCPGTSPAIEQWVTGNQLTWTSTDITPGTYKIEVANGNYQGVPNKVVDLLSGHLIIDIRVSN